MCVRSRVGLIVVKKFLQWRGDVGRRLRAGGESACDELCSAVADHIEFRRVCEITVRSDADIDLVMLHDSDHSLDERILREQFG